MRWIPTFLIALSLAGCGLLDSPPAEPTKAPVLVVGVDGFEWDVLLPLVREGQVPTIAKLMASGSYGLLETTRPTFSPIIWTSIATGKTAKDHGIHGFVTKEGPTKEGTGTKKDLSADRSRRLYNSYDRKAKAFWNVLSDYGRSMAIVGWWMTYPAEPVNGVMVAQVNTLDQANRQHGENILKGSLLEGVQDQVYPADRLEESLEVHRRVSDSLEDLNQEIFGEMDLPMSPLVERMWENTQWSFRSDATYVELASKLAKRDYDLVAFYLGGPDVVGHRFWRYYEPENYDVPPTEEEIAEYGHLIPDYYRFVDRSIERVLAEMPSDTRVLIVADHGMHSMNHQRKFNSENVPKRFSSGHHHDAPPGVLIASGPGVRASAGSKAMETLQRDDLPVIGSVTDVTPTLLAILGVPAGEDMAGTVMTGLLEPTIAELPRISTHDTSEWLERRANLDPKTLEEDSERLEQLKALGYIN